MSTVLGIVFIVVILAGSITLHEFMHAYVSYRLGDETAKWSGRLSLNPLWRIDPFGTVLLPLILYLAHLPVFGAAKPVPFDPSRLRYGDLGAAAVALAGPFTNFTLAVVLAWLLRFTPSGTLMVDFLELAILVNIGFFVFNLIPFPPLDGSRLLYALAPEPLRQLMRRIEAFGLVGIMLFIFVFFPLISPILGSMITALVGVLIPGFNIGSI